MSRLERYDNNAWRILDADRSVIGMVLRLANDGWAVFDRSERRLSSISFGDPSSAFYWWQENIAAGRKALQGGEDE